MFRELCVNERFVKSLPLPLAQLYCRAHHAKTPLERLQAAYFLWEAAVKLLASVTLAEVGELGRGPNFNQPLQNPACPDAQHWWESARDLLPILAESHPEFQTLKDGFRQEI